MDNCISEGKNSILYDDLNEFFMRLDENFSHIIKQSYNCFYLEPKNNIPEIIMLLYVIERKLTVYLASENDLSKNEVPNFCDYIISVEKKFTGADLQISISKNPKYCDLYFEKLEGESIIFKTSGSTGSPKFICFKVDNLIRNSQLCQQRFNHKVENKVLIAVPISHMYGLGAGLLPAYLTKSSIRIIDKTNVLSLIENIKIFQPQISYVTPTLCKMLIKIDKQIKNKSVFISAGENITGSLLKIFKAKYGKIINLYGCSEMGAMATSDSNDLKENDLVPLEGVTFKVNENQDGNDLLCKHPAAFSHYLNTTENFNQHQKFSQGWFTTGDTGSIKENGNIQIFGRKGLLINRSGFLLSIPLIESKIEEIINEIRKTVIVKGTDNSMTAVCELHVDSVIEENRIRKLLISKLPRHAVPDKLCIVNEIPLLINGKPDRMKLNDIYKLNNYDN